MSNVYRRYHNFAISCLGSGKVAISELLPPSAHNDSDNMSNLINPQPARQRTPSPNPTSPLSPISPWPPLPRSTTPSSNQDAPISANNVSNDGDGATSEHSRSQSVASTSKGDELPTAKEIYGLIAVLGTYLAFGVYLVWAFTPDEWLHAVGWTWYPSR